MHIGIHQIINVAENRTDFRAVQFFCKLKKTAAFYMEFSVFRCIADYFALFFSNCTQKILGKALEKRFVLAESVYKVVMTTLAV